MLTSDFDYHLPPELIAQTPLEPRDSSRLLVLDRSTGGIQHRRFTGIVDYLRAGEVMVFNQSRVIPGRLRGRRADTGGKVEFLLLRLESPGVWQALAQPGRRLRPGAQVVLEPPASSPGSGGNPTNPPLRKGGATDIFTSRCWRPTTTGPRRCGCPPMSTWANWDTSTAALHTSPSGRPGTLSDRLRERLRQRRRSYRRAPLHPGFT